VRNQVSGTPKQGGAPPAPPEAARNPGARSTGAAVRPPPAPAGRAPVQAPPAAGAAAEHEPALVPPDQLGAFANDEELAPPLPEPSAGSLFDLDIPSADDLGGRSRSSEPPPSSANTTLDAELDAIEVLDSDPPDSEPDVLEVPMPPARRSDGPERRVSIPPPERARSAEEQHEQRRRRTIDRVLTLRDSFRLMSHLDVPETERKALGRQLIGLDKDLGVAAGLSVIKDPAQALQTVTKEQLDIAERQINLLEDKMLALDDAITRRVFRQRVVARSKQSKKIVARYGRLLASKRMPAGQRRDRFEWIATHLLTGRTQSGELAIMAPERALGVVQHLIGGLPRKVRQQELEEALTYLNEAQERLSRMSSHEELFESGLFLDFHGYKVSMREQLLSAEFLYLSVSLNVTLYNKLEEWIADRERLHDANQLTSDGTPREQIMGRLHAQEAEVDASFGVRRRSLGRIEAVRPESHRPKVEALIESQRAPKVGSGLSIGFAIDRSFIALIVAAVVVIGTGASLLFTTGMVGKVQVKALDGKALDHLSPLLVRGMYVGKGEDRKLKAWTLGKRWEATEPRKRSEAADQLAKTLSLENVRDAEVMLLSNQKPVITIERGTVTLVQGGKL
jgi:hypothetical protein